MKIVLINCYSDNNKGDLGIILGTLNSLFKAKKNILVSAVSSFEIKDPYYLSHHSVLRKFVSEIYPTIMGRVYSEANARKVLVVLFDLLRSLLILFTPLSVSRRLFLNRSERKTLSHLMSADMVISKGGSFICNTKGLIAAIKLWRELMIFILAIKSGRRIVILGQSIGPVNGWVSTLLTNYVLSRCHMVVLREDECLKEYKNIAWNKFKLVVGYDYAFCMDKGLMEDFPLNNEGKSIALTLKRYASKEKDELFNGMIVEVINYIVDELKYNVIIVPHVTIDDDYAKSLEVINLLDQSIRKNVELLPLTLTLGQLLTIYSKVRLLVGTRLHSTIFAMTMGTPSVNIEYHGTKGRGVFKQMGLEEYVIQSSNLSAGELREIISRIISDDQVNGKIDSKVSHIRSSNFELVKELLSV